MSEIHSRINDVGLTSKKGNKVSKSQVEAILKNPFYYGYMKYNDILYKHVHPVLITKELFDECTNVRTGRKKTKYKRTEKPFILKSLLKCQHCGCSYSPEIKKGKYVYMRPTKSKGDCSYCHHLSEKKILSQIEEVLKGMVIPEHILKDLHIELKKSSDKEHKHQIEEGKKLQDKYQSIQNRIKRARELFLDGEINKDEHDDMVTELQVERHNTETRLQRLSNADENFTKQIATIFSLASRSYELFKSSKLEEKRLIITILFPNLSMNGDKLVMTARKPFDMFLNLGDRPEWLPTFDILRTDYCKDIIFMFSHIPAPAQHKL